MIVKDREKAGGIDTDKPVSLCPAQCGSKERVVFLAVLQTGKALFDCAVLHRRNPKAAHRFLAARHFIDKAENEFSLAPCVAGIDDFGNICPVHKFL